MHDDDGDDGLSADRERRTALAARLEAFEVDYAQGSITGQQLAKATATVEAQLAEVDGRLAVGLQRSAALPIASAPDPSRAFLDAPLDVQRAVLRQLLNVEVGSATGPGVAWSKGPPAADAGRLVRLFHVTPHAEAILRDGFRDSTGDYGFRDDDGSLFDLSGVFLSAYPVGVEEASGDVLVVTLPDDLDLDDFSLVEDDAPAGWRREWVIPADVLNRLGTVERGA
jgi:hypothetical protein